MKNLFLTLKSWQLFLLIFLIPMVVGGFSINYALNHLHYSHWMNAIMGLMFFIEIGIFLWFHAIVFGLDNRLATELQSTQKWFGIFVITRFVGLFSALKIIDYLVFCSYTDGVKFPIGDKLGTIIAGIIVSVLLAFLAQLGTIFTVAKTIKTNELQAKVSFSNYIGEAVMLYFLPIGIFILQPKINNFFKNEI